MGEQPCDTYNMGVQCIKLEGITPSRSLAVVLPIKLASSPAIRTFDKCPLALQLPFLPRDQREDGRDRARKGGSVCACERE